MEKEVNILISGEDLIKITEMQDDAEAVEFFGTEYGIDTTRITAASLVLEDTRPIIKLKIKSK